MVLKRIVFFVVVGLASAATTYTLRTAIAADSPAPSAADLAMKPTDYIAKIPKGQIKNPYKDSQADIVAQGEHIFLSYGCNGCHGGGGGGGMCPPLTNDVWVYDGDDDTIFRLVTLGSDALQAQGYTRKGRENVVGPMPPFGQIVKSTDDLFKMFVFVRFEVTAQSADQKYKYGTPRRPKIIFLDLIVSSGVWPEMVHPAVFVALQFAGVPQREQSQSLATGAESVRYPKSRRTISGIRPKDGGKNSMKGPRSCRVQSEFHIQSRIANSQRRPQRTKTCRHRSPRHALVVSLHEGIWHRAIDETRKARCSIRIPFAKRSIVWANCCAWRAQRWKVSTTRSRDRDSPSFFPICKAR